MAEKTYSPFQLEQLEVMKKLLGFTEGIEANVVSIFYKNPNSLYDFPNLSIHNFHHNIWKVYFNIIYDLVVKQNKEIIDEYVIEFYLEQHSSLKEKYDEYGGYETIIKASEYVEIKNIFGYVGELTKWCSIWDLNKTGYPIKNKLSEYADMSTDELYADIEAKINNVFLKNIDNINKAYDISDGIDEFIEKLEEGMLVGLPYLNMPILSNETGGSLEGNITLVGATSNTGKSSFVRNSYITQLIQLKEPCIVMLNEENLQRMQRELIVYYANNFLHYDLDKTELRNGKWKEETKNIILKSVGWIKSMKKDKLLTIIPFKEYNTNSAVRTINKYSSLGVKHFCLDTFKLDSGVVSKQARLEMVQNMVKLYDTVKEESRNVHLLCTFQLSKNSENQRYFTQDNIGEAKSIIDVSSTGIMMRDVKMDEIGEDSSNKIVVYKDEVDSQGAVRHIIIPLDPSKHYQIIFIVKTREGSKSKQIVIEHDLGKNIIKEIGYTYIKNDR